MKLLIQTIILLIISTLTSLTQVETQRLDTTKSSGTATLYYFTNRPRIIHDSEGVEFVDKYQYATDTLTFGAYHLEKDSLTAVYRAAYNRNVIKDLPREENFLYQVYEDFVIKRGIYHFEILIPGFAKTFTGQRQNFMRRIKEVYADTLANRVAFITYAWADEWRPYKYHKAKKSATAGAYDYYLFHYLLQNFMQDSAFFANNPADFTVGLTCLSMGNELLKRFILLADEHGVEFRKTYNHIIMIGSDASWDSFLPGKGFDRIDRLTDRVFIVMNRKDGPLLSSQVMNMKKRLGRHGPKKPWKLPDYVEVYDITGKLSAEDRKGLGHEYLVRNPFLQDLLISQYQLLGDGEEEE